MAQRLRIRGGVPGESLTHAFLNKAYTIVAKNHDEVFALYLHDHKWWLIKQDKDKLDISERQQITANDTRITGY